MIEFIEHDYLELFISSLLSATILPLNSEVVLNTLLINNFSPFQLILTATLGYVFGSVINYKLGTFIHKSISVKNDNNSNQQLNSAELKFQKFGLLSLCFAWVPIIGDPLTFVAGLLRVNFMWFIVLITVGKLARFSAISYIILNSTSN